ncbi:MAG: hypothetical protein AAF766_16870 [Cyanobacteria bacterium P01_D01_bin.14]
MSPAPLPSLAEIEERAPQSGKPIIAAPSRRSTDRPSTDRPRVRASQRRGVVRQSTVLEASVKLTVNLLLGVVAASTLARLVPYYRGQSAELSSLQQATHQLSQENQALWAEFSRNFAPEQASQVMQEQSGRQAATQMPVVWVDPLATPE